MIVDSHCHLIYFSDDEIPKVISRAEQSGVKVLHNICVSIDDVPKLLKISSSYDYVYSSVGVHPLDATIENSECIRVDELVELTKNQKVISIGETGLDFYKSNNKSNQRKSFALHIEAARITGLPLVIHALCCLLYYYINNLISHMAYTNSPIRVMPWRINYLEE